MYNAELGGHPATSGPQQKRRGNEQLRYAVDSTIEGLEAQVVSSVLVEVQKEVGEFWETTCRRGPWLFDKNRGRTIRVPCKSKACKVCRRKKAKEYATELEQKEVEYYSVIPKKRWDAYRRKLARKGFVYRRFPVEDDMLIVVSNMGGQELPEDLVEFLDDVIVRTQGMGKIGGSKVFGKMRPTSTGQYWRPRGRWSLEEVMRDISIALKGEAWKLIPYESGDGFRLIGLRKVNARILELAGIVGNGGEIIW